MQKYEKCICCSALVATVVATLTDGWLFDFAFGADGNRSNDTNLSKNNLTFGKFIGSHNVTSDEQTWPILGYWKTNMFLLQNKTTNQSSGGSDSQASTDNNKIILVNSSSSPIFYANIPLLRLDGSMPVVHTIKDFKLLNVSTEATGFRAVLKGSSMVNTTRGEIANVSTTITIRPPEKGFSYTEVTIFPDPSKVNYEFGKTPLYSLVRNYDTSVPSNLLNIPM